MMKAESLTGVPVLAIRQGAVDPSGAYFSTRGSSTYFDVDNAAAGKYDIRNVKLVDTSDMQQCIALLEETLKDGGLNDLDRGRLQTALDHAQVGEPLVNYFLADDTPMAQAGMRLGYDGMRVMENDDWSDPSSAFIWNIHKVEKLSENQFQHLLAEQNGEVMEGGPIAFAYPDAESTDFVHSGYRIYTTMFRGDPPTEKWLLQTHENMLINKIGMGDTIHLSRSDAIFEAERQQVEQVSKIEAHSKLEAQEVEILAAREANRGLSISERKANSVLAKDVSFNGKIMRLKEVVKHLVNQGAELSTDEVDAIKPMSRMQFFRADGQAQAAHEKRVKEGGKKTLYYIGDYDLGKTAYDYAASLGKDKNPLDVVNEGVFSGRLMEIGQDGIATQKINRAGDTVRHVVASLSQQVKVGDVVDIAYSNGIGIVKGPAQALER